MLYIAFLKSFRENLNSACKESCIISRFYAFSEITDFGIFQNYIHHYSFLNSEMVLILVWLPTYKLFFRMISNLDHPM